jgi:hypothetical protein
VRNSVGKKLQWLQGSWVTPFFVGAALGTVLLL